MTRPDTLPEQARYALFASGAAFSVHVLERLLDAEFTPSLIAIPGYPPAPGPAGGSIVDVTAETAFGRLARDVPRIYVPLDAQLECAGRLRREAIDFMLVACWPYLILPQLFQSPSRAALNLHPSRLPRFRGPDPVTEQLAQQETRLGVTLHRLNRHFDAGKIVAQETFSLPLEQLQRDNIESICAARGVRLFIAAVQTYDEGWNERPQEA